MEEAIIKELLNHMKPKLYVPTRAALAAKERLKELRRERRKLKRKK